MATPTLVQHSAFCGSDGNLFTAFKCLMPNAVLSGNLVIVAILTRIAGGGGINPTIADDKSNTYTAGPTITTSTNKKLHTFFLWNVTNGPRIWTISYTGTGESMDGCAISEYYNVQTSSNPLRTNSTTTNAGGTNPTLTSAALTPTTGDLLWYFGWLDDTTQADTYLTEMTSWTPDSANGMRLLHGDLRLFHAVQDKIATSGSSQTNTLAAAGATDGWAVAVLDFISAAAGTAPAVGAVHVIKAQHFNAGPGFSGDARVAIQFPAIGNCQVLLACTEAGLTAINTIADTASNTWVRRGTYPGDSSVVESQHADLINGTKSDTNVITITYNASLGGGEPHVLFDVENVQGFDKRGTAKDAAAGTGTTFTGASVTPTNANNVVLAVLPEDISTGGLSITDHSPGNFVSSTTTPLITTSPADDNDGFAVIYTTTNATVTSTWTKSATTSIGDWSSILAVYHEIPFAVAKDAQEIGRWAHPGMGVVNQARFAKSLEQYGLLAVPPAAGVVFRKTLSSIGTHTGGRETHNTD